MTNELYDINVGSSLLFPYIGAGLGYQCDDYSNFSTPGGVTANSTKGAFAGQTIHCRTIIISYEVTLHLFVDHFVKSGGFGS